MFNMAYLENTAKCTNINIILMLRCAQINLIKYYQA